MAKLLTTDEAASKLYISRRRVQALIKTGRLPAKKVGRDWLIKSADLSLVEDRINGRPRKDSLW